MTAIAKRRQLEPSRVTWKRLLAMYSLSAATFLNNTFDVVPPAIAAWSAFDDIATNL